MNGFQTNQNTNASNVTKRVTPWDNRARRPTIWLVTPTERPVAAPVSHLPPQGGPKVRSQELIMTAGRIVLSREAQSFPLAA